MKIWSGEALGFLADAIQKKHLRLASHWSGRIPAANRGAVHECRTPLLFTLYRA